MGGSTVKPRSCQGARKCAAPGRQVLRHPGNVERRTTPS
jgi:hypothetical protein